MCSKIGAIPVSSLATTERSARVTMDKEREVWTRIIDVYKDRPHMWDKKTQQYFNRDMRNKTFELMFEIYREHANDITFTNFKKKFENMRTSYARELRKVNASKQTGTGIDDVYKPSLWYFNLFAFYEETTEPTRRGIDTLDAEEVSEDSELNETAGGQSNDHETNSNRNSEPSNSQSINNKLSNRVNKTEEKTTTPKKQRMCLEKKQEKLLDTAQQLMTTTSKTDDWEVIGKSIGLQLRDLSKRQQTIVQKLISDAIFYGKLEKLTEESSINLRNQHTYIQPTYPNINSAYHAQMRPPTPSPQYYAQTPIPTPSPQYYAQTPTPTPSPQYNSQTPITTPSPQYNSQTPITTPSPQYYAQTPTPTPSPQYNSQTPIPTPSPEYYAQMPTPSPSSQHHTQSSMPVRSPQPQNQLCESQYTDSNSTIIDLPNTTFSNNSTIVEGTFSDLKDYLLFKSNK